MFQLFSLIVKILIHHLLSLFISVALFCLTKNQFGDRNKERLEFCGFEIKLKKVYKCLIRIGYHNFLTL